MKSPLTFRRGIPLFYHKSETEYKNDPYERYDEKILRLAAFHYSRQITAEYPLNLGIQLIQKYILPNAAINIVDIGCGVGSWIGPIAQAFSNSSCWGIDYSYQALRFTRDLWINNQSIQLRLKERGFINEILTGHSLTNIMLGLAKAEDLPFASDSQDLVFHSFLIDRLTDPGAALREIHRILIEGGYCMLITPFNYQHAKHWAHWYPAQKLIDAHEKIGLNHTHSEEFSITERLDNHGNKLEWKCTAIVFIK